MITHYSGSHYIWSLRQTAIAAANFPDYPPTEESINLLQSAWASQFGKTPDARDKGLVLDMAWAKQAFGSVANLKYEPSPA